MALSTLVLSNYTVLNDAVKVCKPVGESNTEEEPSAWYANLKIAIEDAGNGLTASDIAQIKKVSYFR